jgi:hypothetical protein
MNIFEEQAIIEMMEQQKRRKQMIGDSEVRELMKEAEHIGHIGFCFGDYKQLECADCPTEMECLKLFIKERADVRTRKL